MSRSTFYRVEALQKFEDVRFRAQICQIGMRLANRPLNLLPLGPIRGRLSAINGVFRGMQEISLAQIVGSLNRAADFDRHFRPLHDSQRDRWVNIWVMHKLSGWDPIVVRQIGNLYFVEDGHHRTSVARSANMSGIWAYVTEYPVAMRFDTHASLASILALLEQLAVADLAPVARTHSVL